MGELSLEHLITTGEKTIMTSDQTGNHLSKWMKTSYHETVQFYNGSQSHKYLAHNIMELYPPPSCVEPLDSFVFPHRIRACIDVTRLLKWALLKKNYTEIVKVCKFYGIKPLKFCLVLCRVMFMKRFILVTFKRVKTVTAKSVLNLSVIHFSG